MLRVWPFKSKFRSDLWLVFEQLDDEGGNEWFLARTRLGNEKREGGEGAVANLGVTVFGKMLVVDGEKNYEKEGADAFVAVIEWVVFDDKIEEVGSLFGCGWVEILAIVALID